MYKYKNCDEDAIACNRAFEEMRKYAVDCLRQRSPEEIADCTGAEYIKEEGILKISSLGQRIEIKPPEYELSPPLEDWHHLVLLHYLYMADGTPLSGEWISFGELKDGLIRGTKFDRTVDEQLGKFLGDLELQEVQRICRSLGGEIRQSKADLCTVIPFLPYYPVMLNVWSADDEFHGTARMLADKSADHYLTVEDAVTLGDIIIKKLKEAADMRN